MDATKFLSSGKFLILPSKYQPKVYLAFDKKRLLDNAFKLYNPFSNKAKIYKSFIVFATKHFKILCSIFLPIVKVKQSEFSKYLNSTLNKQLTISLYISTEPDKLVLQLQDEQSRIYGYLKYPTTEIGKQRILNEKYAISILSNLSIVPELLYFGSYQETPFIILNNIDGVIKRLTDDSYKKVLKSFHKEKKYNLCDHPRVMDLQDQLKLIGLNVYHEKLKRVIQNSNAMYKEVYEHGDFTPWNLIQMEEDCIPFDFEYFKEKGLEYLDEIKYHFQINHLLHGKTGYQLINTIASKVDIKDFVTIFQIFLIKEIINKHETSKPYGFESLLFKKVTSEKV